MKFLLFSLLVTKLCFTTAHHHRHGRDSKVLTSCADVSPIRNGIYEITVEAGRKLRVFCEFTEPARGYAYISTDSLKVGDDYSLAGLYTETDFANLKSKQDGSQKNTRISQLPKFKDIPLSFQLSKYTGYTHPSDAVTVPYLYFGMVPAHLNTKGTVAGYTVNGYNYEFTNCDGNPNSYMAFYVTTTRAQLATQNRSWRTNAQNTLDILPDEFFFNMEEHQGGCGTLTRGSGVALGLPFSYNNLVLTSCADVSPVRNGIYEITVEAGRKLRVFCEFEESGRGYAYISAHSLKVGDNYDISELYTETDIVYLKSKQNAAQKNTRISQLPKFKDIPLSFQVNSYTGYTQPTSVVTAPYLYFGMIPAHLNTKGTVAGYTVNGYNYEFTNCDGNPNSYMAFYITTTRAQLATQDRSWRANAQNTLGILPDEFFFNMEEHQGGCGTLTRGSGVALGLPFTYSLGSSKEDCWKGRRPDNEKRFKKNRGAAKDAEETIAVEPITSEQ